MTTYESYLKNKIKLLMDYSDTLIAKAHEFYEIAEESKKAGDECSEKAEKCVEEVQAIIEQLKNM